MLTTRVESGENEMGKGEESHRRTRDKVNAWQAQAAREASCGRRWLIPRPHYCVRSKESTRVLDNETAQLNKGEGNLQDSCCCEYSTFRFGVQFSPNWVHNIWPPPEP